MNGSRFQRSMLAVVGSLSALLSAGVVVAQELNVIAYDTSADSVIASTALLMAAQGMTHQGVIISSFQATGADQFGSSLDSGLYNFVILDTTGGAPNGDWPGALSRFIDGGGCAIVAVGDATEAAAIAPLFEAEIGAAHDALPISRWNQSPLFDLFQTVPSPLAVADNVLEPNGFFLDPVPPAVAAAGFTADPAPDQAAIVVGNGGRTMLHGFLTDDLYPGDADADTVDDVVELVQNEIFAAGLSGCTAPISPPPPVAAPVDVPTLNAAGLAALVVAFAAAAFVAARRRRLRAAAR